MNQLERDDRAEPTDPRRIPLHGPDDFAAMRRAGQLAAATLDYITPHVVPGVTTAELDRLCHEFIVAHGATPAPLGYRGFPKSICTSINHVVCHGIPGTRVVPGQILMPKSRRRLPDKIVSDGGVLFAGDILNIDVTVILDGWHGDTSRMFAVGLINYKERRLIKITHDAMMKGIQAVKPGSTLGDIGHCIQNSIESEGFSVVRDFCGHGIGRKFHEQPNILHYGRQGEGLPLRPGMIFTIEPMVNIGDPSVKVLEDGWTAVTADGSLSAQFEHTVGVTATGCEVFTFSPGGLHKPPYTG